MISLNILRIKGEVFPIYKLSLFNVLQLLFLLFSVVTIMQRLYQRMCQTMYQILIDTFFSCSVTFCSTSELVYLKRKIMAKKFLLLINLLDR